MKNYNVDLFAVTNEFNDRAYSQKLRNYYRKAIQKIQIGLLVTTFLYMPVYCALLLFDVVNIISKFSACCILSYLTLIAFFVFMNRERHTFRRNINH